MKRKKILEPGGLGGKIFNIILSGRIISGGRNRESNAFEDKQQQGGKKATGLKHVFIFVGCCFVVLRKRETVPERGGNFRQLP